MCLAGRTREVLHNDIEEFDAIVTRLQASFGEQLFKRKFKMMLQNRKIKSNEQLTDLTSDIRFMTT